MKTLKLAALAATLALSLGAAAPADAMMMHHGHPGMMMHRSMHRPMMHRPMMRHHMMRRMHHRMMHRM